MLRSQALTALFNANTDTTAEAIFFSTLSGHLIGSSTPTPTLPQSLIKKASILGTSTFAYYAQQPPDPDADITRQSSQVSSRGSAQTQPQSQIQSQSQSQTLSLSQTSPSVSSRGSVRFGGAGYSAIQPLPALGRVDWDGEGEGEGVLRRVVVMLGSEGGRRMVGVEGVGEGIVVGVVGAEIEGERERDDGEGEEGESEEGEVGGKNLAVQMGRRVRLLDVKTEALAEFMRGEFEGFRMPKVDL